MLNELYMLGKTLGDVGIKSYSWHPQYKVLPKNMAFRIFIGEGDELISSIEPLASEKLSALRKWEPNLGDSFPCFNFQPITFESKSSFVKSIGNNSPSFDSVTACRLNLDEKRQKSKTDFDKKLNKILGELPERLSQILGDPPPEFSSFNLLVNRLKGVNAEKFIEAIIRYICSNPDKLNELSPIMFTGKPVQVVLDVDEYDAVSGYPVSHEKTVRWINDRLNEQSSENQKTKQAAGETDAFGDSATGSNQKLPSVVLPIIGKVILRSMVEETKCQLRYGKADYDSFRIGEDNHAKLKSAIEWLARENFKGRTWHSIGRKGKKAKAEVLFAYLSEIPNPEEPMEVTKIFCGSEQDESNFLSALGVFFQTLQGIPKPLGEIDIRMFVIREMDTARRKVVYNTTFSAQTLRDKATVWKEACLNVPISDYTPKPFELNEILRNFMLSKEKKQKGKKNHDKEEVEESGSKFPKTTGLDLLLGRIDDSQPTLLNLLHFVLGNAEKLIIPTAHFMNKGKVFEDSGKFARHKILLPVMLGLLMYKLGHKKEDYMKSQAYLTGNFLALSDKLHYQYCKYVRTTKHEREQDEKKVNVPPELIGCALMSTALDSPTIALARLAERIRPYAAWAGTYQGENFKSIRWILKKYRELSEELAQTISEEKKRMTDAEKAMLLLGYLAGAKRTIEDDKTEGGNSNG